MFWKLIKKVQFFLWVDFAFTLFIISLVILKSYDILIIPWTSLLCICIPAYIYVVITLFRCCVQYIKENPKEFSL